MKKLEIVEQWLKRAASNLARAREGKTNKDILYEDLCFDCQQCAEKSLKALYIFFGIKLIFTHSISFLLNTLEEKNIKIPEFIKDAVILADYAVQTRYPGIYEPIDEEEYKEALLATEKVYEWVKSIIEK